MENLENSAKKLSLLVEPKLTLALEDYVHKGEAQVSAVSRHSVPSSVPAAAASAGPSRNERARSLVSRLPSALMTSSMLNQGIIVRPTGLTINNTKIRP